MDPLLSHFSSIFHKRIKISPRWIQSVRRCSTLNISNVSFRSDEEIWPRATRRDANRKGVARENRVNEMAEETECAGERHGEEAAWQRSCCPRRHYGPKSLSTPGFPIPHGVAADSSLPYFHSFSFSFSSFQDWEDSFYSDTKGMKCE